MYIHGPKCPQLCKPDINHGELARHAIFNPRHYTPTRTHPHCHQHQEPEPHDHPNLQPTSTPTKPPAHPRRTRTITPSRRIHTVRSSPLPSPQPAAGTDAVRHSMHAICNPNPLFPSAAALEGGIVLASNVHPPSQTQRYGRKTKAAEAHRAVLALTVPLTHDLGPGAGSVPVPVPHQPGPSSQLLLPSAPLTVTTHAMPAVPGSHDCPERWNPLLCTTELQLIKRSVLANGRAGTV